MMSWIRTNLLCCLSRKSSITLSNASRPASPSTLGSSSSSSPISSSSYSFSISRSKRASISRSCRGASPTSLPRRAAAPSFPLSSSSSSSSSSLHPINAASPGLPAPRLVPPVGGRPSPSPSSPSASLLSSSSASFFRWPLVFRTGSAINSVSRSTFACSTKSSLISSNSPSAASSCSAAHRSSSISSCRCAPSSSSSTAFIALRLPPAPPSSSSCIVSNASLGIPRSTKLSARLRALSLLSREAAERACEATDSGAGMNVPPPMTRRCCE
mmetsp:Transcript_6511/g.15742  ORF Transcript_6511/g.15742 Transcript_6511/m.15742 type:complete len:271 (-) Transcript_6511:315-1127(-)